MPETMNIVYHGLLTNIHECRLCDDKENEEEWQETLTCKGCRQEQLEELREVREREIYETGCIEAETNRETHNKDYTVHRRCYNRQLERLMMLIGLNSDDRSYLSRMSKDIYIYMLETYVFREEIMKHMKEKDEHKLKKLPLYMKDNVKRVIIKLSDEKYMLSIYDSEYMEYKTYISNEPFRYIHDGTPEYEKF